MKILVTGAAGFIGSHLSERLCALGHEVVGLDCFTPYYAQSLKEINAQDVRAAGASLLTLDLASDDLSEAVNGVQVVYHLAAQPGIAEHVPFADYERNNILATHRLLEALRSSPTLQLFVNIGTSSIYGADATHDETASPEPTTYYGVTKLAAEQLALALYRDKSFPACSFRLFSVYGPRERPEKLYPKLIKAILDDQEFPLFEGSRDHLRSFTYVGDIVDGLCSALDHQDVVKGEIFNLGIDTAITTGEGIDLIEEIIGKKARIVVRPRRSGDQLRTHADIGKARRLLGYNPQTQPREGLTEAITWYRERIWGKVSF
ncbi:MAG: NAD-dependent epimerase/dehydratase family protein [Anaerolineales bacterium]